jgi:outer membrane lipoprotein-sorting protein
MCIITCVAFYFASYEKSLAAEKINFLEQYSKELSQIETYLNNIHDLSAKFIQESSGGKIIEGNFFLSRPGKMRIEYLAQPKILIIVNGAVLAYQDVELEETSHISTNTTPASFLTRQNISFSAKDVEITNVKKSADQIKVSLMKKNRKEAGEFSLIFANNPLRFIKMEVKNDLDQIVTVTLRDLNFSNPLSKNLFIIKNKNLPQ